MVNLAQGNSKEKLVTLERKGETKTITLPKKFSKLTEAATLHFAVEVRIKFKYKYNYNFNNYYYIHSTHAHKLVTLNTQHN